MTTKYKGWTISYPTQGWVVISKGQIHNDLASSKGILLQYAYEDRESAIEFIDEWARRKYGEADE